MPSGSNSRDLSTSPSGARPARATSTPSTSAAALYCQRSPGWYISGRVPNSLIHSSGGYGVRGSGGPSTRLSSSPAVTIGNGGGEGGPVGGPQPTPQGSRCPALVGGCAGAGLVH